MKKTFLTLLVFSVSMPCFGAAATPKKVEKIAQDSKDVFLDFGSFPQGDEIWTHYSNNPHNHMIFPAYRDESADEKNLIDTDKLGTEVFCTMIAYRFFEKDGPRIYLKKHTACSCAEIKELRIDITKIPFLETYQFYLYVETQQLFVRLTKEKFKGLKSASCLIL
jgi:hypothetical protein